MKPKIFIDSEKSIITIKLFQGMSHAEVLEFLEELRLVVAEFKESGIPFSVLNDAEEKTFEDLSAVRVLSQGLRRILNTGSVNRFAVYRPQDDFHSEEELTQPDKIKTFIKLEDAQHWLLLLRNNDYSSDSTNDQAFLRD